MELPRETQSLCPQCKKVLPATIYEEDGKVMIKKTCPEHGETKEVYWGDAEMYHRASQYANWGHFGVTNPNVDNTGAKCPYDCGLCKRHKNHTALANIVLTNRCDLSCWYCFFYAKKGQPIYEPSLEELRAMFKSLRNEQPVPCTAVQLTGGEPTLREDLPEIIRIAKEEGFSHVQLNTNIINIANKPELAKKYREAGVNTIYMSFDGVTAKTNPKNHWEAPKAIKAFREAGQGVVLVPTVIRGVNDHELGDILRFAADNLDVVRGVDFQPVSLVGMMPQDQRAQQRITIPDTIKAIEEQTGGQISREDFYPIPCVSPINQFVEALTGQPKYRLANHFACGMATYAFKQNDGTLLPITRFIDVDGLFNFIQENADKLKEGKNKYLVGMKMLSKIGSFIDKQKQPEGFSTAKLIFNALVKHDYKALGVFHHKTLFIGMMHFQDPYNYDVQRVERCSIHYAMPDGRIIPFCAFNVLPEVYRDEVQNKYSISPEEWEKKAGKKLADDRYLRTIKE